MEVPGQAVWSSLASPNNDFKVELPKTSKIRSVKLKTEEESISEMFNNKANTANYEIETEDSNTVHRFRVIIFYPSASWSNGKFASESNSYMLFLFGDDKHFSKQSDVKIGGLHGREYIFKKGGGRGRALFLNAKERIYFLSYFEEKNAEPESSIANRVFTTFKVLNK